MLEQSRTVRRLPTYKAIVSIIATIVLLLVILSLWLFVSATGGDAAVNAPGGTISNTSTTLEVAGIFDSTATTDSNGNLTVTGGGSAFTVTLKTDLILNGMITVDSGVTLTILGDGDRTITRGEGCDTHLFSSTNGNLVLGSGSISDNTITYTFNTGDIEVYPVGGTIPESTVERYVTHTTVNTSITGNPAAGSLTIDGNADLAAYSGVQFSAPINSTGNNDDRNLIKAVGGSVTMWDGVTLQNNVFIGNDTYGGGAVNLNNSIMNIYGGTIHRCVNTSSTNGTSSSRGDGGAIFLQGESARLYMYGGTITECESDNSSAISLWNSSALYLMGGTISRNFSVGDGTYPAQAISAYNTSRMFIYGGDISGNHGINNIADIRVSTTGLNTLHFYEGHVGSIVANDNLNNMIYVYAGSANSITPSGKAQLIRYTGNMRSVLLSDAVQGDGGQIVRVTIYDSEGIIVGAFNMTGSGTVEAPNPNLVLDLSVGEHLVVINSVSMEKTYDVTVTDTGFSMTSSILMTTVQLSAKTATSITLSAAGTGNDVDGTMYYGYSVENGPMPTTWQPSPVFTGLDVGKYYCYVKVVSEDYPSGLVTPTPLMVPIASISIAENVLLAPGGSYAITPAITPDDCLLDGIVWSLSNATGTETTVRRNGSGCGVVSIGADEPPGTVITISADLYGRTASVNLLVTAACSPSSALPADATVVAGDELTWTMPGGTGYTFQWQRLNGTVWENIPGKTTETYLTTTSDIDHIIRLVTTYDGTDYCSTAVIVLPNDPIFTVIIPESIAPISTTGSFNIQGNMRCFTLSQSLTVSCSGDFKLELTGAPSSTLDYTLCRDSDYTSTIAKDGTGIIKTFSGNGSQTVPVYYVIDTPVYSGTYTDTLTFTVSFDSGS